jgi:hypothetical protein
MKTRGLLIRIFFSLFCSIPSFGVAQEVFGIEQITSDRIEYKGSSIILTGHVRVVLEIGVVTCEKGQLFLSKTPLSPEVGGVEKITLLGDVKIAFSDGDLLEADRADLNCQAFEGHFYSVPPKKVVYTTASKSVGEGDTTTPPMRASSEVLHAKIRKVEGQVGYQLTDLEGEGAVLIECIRLDTSGELK